MDTPSQNPWGRYYQATAGRPPRPLLVKALGIAKDTATSPERIAVDIGCGDGTDTLALLECKWHVIAIDSTPEAIPLLLSRVSSDNMNLLTTQTASFAEMELPPADFIFAGLSLPFCHPYDFDAVWGRIVDSLRSGGRFAGHFFGVRDTWATSSEMTFHTDEQVKTLFNDFHIEYFQEIEEDGQAVSGPKHWHLFEVIARAKTLKTGKKLDEAVGYASKR